MTPDEVGIACRQTTERWHSQVAAWEAERKIREASFVTYGWPKFADPIATELDLEGTAS